MPFEGAFDRPVKTQKSLEQSAIILKRREAFTETNLLLQPQVKPERLLPEPDHYHPNNSTFVICHLSSFRPLWSVKQRTTWDLNIRCDNGVGAGFPRPRP